MKFYNLVFFTAVLLAACSGESARIDGRFAGCAEQKVYLERLLPGSQAVIDSATLDGKGAFSFKVKLQDGQSVIFNVRCQNEIIPVILAPGQRIKLSSMGNIAHNYTVSGSEASAELKELKTILSTGISNLDSLMNRYSAADDDARTRLGAEYTSEYYRTKREHIRFIVTHPSSLSGFFALYQRMPGDTYLFNDENDIVYYRLVADSLELSHPDSPYLAALRKEIAAGESGREIANLLSEKLTSAPDDFPDFEMKDMYGNNHRLSSHRGKVILLDFWSVESNEGRLNNAEYKGLYDKYAPAGFEIFQVSVDRNREAWVNAVQRQKLPWISVCDLKGGAGFAPMAYNVTGVPANYLIDSEGTIVERDIFGERLTSRVDQLTR